MIKVSVIVPIYNVAPYILDCLNSIHAQSLTDVEIILVDDHGSDDSMMIVRQFIQANNLHSSWHIIETPSNSGPAYARNLGLSIAKGMYVLFIDADDWIEPEMLQTLHVQAERYKADISSCAAILDYKDGHHTYMFNPQVESGELSPTQRRYLLLHYVSNFTTMFFRREWLLENEILFPLTKSGEDSSFVGQCYLVCRRIAQTNETYYHYVIHSGSLTQRKVWKGQEKRKAFAVLIDFAKRKKLLRTYWPQLFYIYLKKALIVPICEMIK